MPPPGIGLAGQEAAPPPAAGAEKEPTWSPYPASRHSLTSVTNLSPTPGCRVAACSAVALAEGKVSWQYRHVYGLMGPCGSGSSGAGGSSSCSPWR
jgi:hypothetical protein